MMYMHCRHGRNHWGFWMATLAGYDINDTRTLCPPSLKPCSNLDLDDSGSSQNPCWIGWLNVYAREQSIVNTEMPRLFIKHSSSLTLRCANISMCSFLRYDICFSRELLSACLGSRKK